MKKGFVVLVGAGPGDKGLLTLRGMEYIQRAEVILYDRLVSEDILELAPIGAKKIDVGKESSNHLVAQEKINQMLLDEASRGKLVIRLKGGDPFLFGRGGEELELLEQNGVPYEVVPGITSAIAAPAYAGIPVTHRDFCSSLHIITGHNKKNNPLEINFEALVALGGTLVFMMSVSSLKQILDGLLYAGINKSTPAAIVENGARACQRKVVATVETLYDKAAEEKIKSPSVVIIGEVCRLSERFDWFSKRTLSGKKIIVTSPKSSGGTLSTKLRELGADVIDYPCIEIREIMENSQLEQAFNNIKNYAWLVFTSKNGVSILFDYLRRQKKDFRVLAGLKIAATGRQTAQALADYGILADYVPEVFDGEHLGEGLCKVCGVSEKILLTRAQKGGTEIIDIFRANGRQYEDIAIYDTVYTNTCSQGIETLIRDNPGIYVTFTSASTVEGFVKSNENFNLKNITGICIGRQTAKAAERYGIKHYISDEATIESMVKKFGEVQNERNKTAKTEK